MGKKSKHKKKPIKWKDLTINALIDLIIGIILLMIEKYIGQGESPNHNRRATSPPPIKNITQTQCRVKSMILKLGVFFVVLGVVKLLVALIVRAKEKEGKE